MAFVVVILLIYLIALILGRLTNLPFGYLLAPAIFCIVIWQYLFGLANILNVGFESLAITSSGIFLYLLRRHKDFRKQVFTSLFSVSSLTMISLSLVSYIKSKHWLLSQWDEFSSWGLAIKAMYKYGELAPATPADLWTPEYPPGIALFQYFVIDTDFGWKEGYLFWSIHLIALSILVSVLATTSFKNISEIAIKFFTAFIAAAIFFNYWDSIYADPTLAITFALLLFISIRGDCLKGKWTIIFVATAGFLTLVKPIAIYFVLSAILVNIVVTVCSLEHYSVRGLLLKLRPAGTTLFAVVAIWGSWQRFVSRLDVHAATGTGIPTNFARLANEQFNLELISLYVKAFFNSSLNLYHSPSMPGSYWTIFCIIFFVIWMYLSGRKNRSRNFAIGISLVITTIGYFGLVLYSYMFIFTPSEASGLASYARYIATWYQGIILAVVMLVLSEIKLNQVVNFPFSREVMQRNSISMNQISVLIFAFLSLNIFSSANNYLNMLRVPKDNGIEWRSPLNPIISAIKRAKIPEGSRIYIITQHRIGFEYYILRYEMIGLDFGTVPFSIGTPYGEGDAWTDPTMDAVKWSETLRDFDYVVLSNTTDSFTAEFSTLFPNGIVEPNSVYRVDELVNGVILTKAM